MKISWKTENLQILDALAEKEKAEVLEAFSHGRHFLAVYLSSLLIPICLFFVIPYLRSKYYPETEINIWIYVTATVISAGFLRIVEINLINRKILKDIIKDRSNKSAHTTAVSAPR